MKYHKCAHISNKHSSDFSRRRPRRQSPFKEEFMITDLQLDDKALWKLRFPRR